MTGDPAREPTLRNGLNLTEWARQETLVTVDFGPDALARVFAAAWSDGWIDFDYQGWPSDPSPPPKFAFRYQHLQRCDSIRIKRDAWPAIPALRMETRAAPGKAAFFATPERDLFICHAGEDKDAVARPLAQRLQAAGYKVWYDEFDILTISSACAGLSVELQSVYLDGDLCQQVLVSEYLALDLASVDLSSRWIEGADRVFTCARTRYLYDHLQRLQDTLAERRDSPIAVERIDVAEAEIRLGSSLPHR